MGNNLRDEGQESESIRWYKEAISLRKNHRSQHYNLGQAYFALFDFDKAIEQYEYILTHINSNDLDAIRQKEMAIKAKRMGILPSDIKEQRKRTLPSYKWRDRLAEKHYLEAVRLSVMDAPIGQVKAEIDEALRREPENEDEFFWSHACYTYAGVAVTEKNVELAKRAVEMGEKALELHEEGRCLDEENLFLLYEGLTFGYLKIDKNAEAEIFCKKALDIVPDSKSMNNMLNLINKEKKSPRNSEATSSEKKGCFIATAVYGNPYAPPVILLRDFRDNILQKTLRGKIFIWIYYRLSPFLANAIRKSEAFKKLARILIVEPAWRVAKSFEKLKVNFKGE